MIRALGAHAWLLMTFRHNGQGLPQTSGFALYAIVAAYVLMAVLRWHDEHGIINTVVAVMLFLVAISWFSAKAAIGYAIISTCTDLIGFLMPQSDGANHLLSCVELCLLGAFATNLWRHGRTKR